MDTSKVTHFEVIDEGGRCFADWNVSVELQLQDDGRTLKAFLKHNDPKVAEKLHGIQPTPND